MMDEPNLLNPVSANIDDDLATPKNDVNIQELVVFRGDSNQYSESASQETLAVDSSSDSRDFAKIKEQEAEKSKEKLVVEENRNTTSQLSESVGSKSPFASGFRNNSSRADDICSHSSSTTIGASSPLLPRASSTTTTPLFPICIIEDEISNSSATKLKRIVDIEEDEPISPKKRKADWDLKIRDLWAAKIHLQSACGIDPKNNLRVSGVIKKAVDTIETLEVEDLKRKQEVMFLVSKQAKLFDRIVHFKRRLTSKRYTKK